MTHDDAGEDTLAGIDLHTWRVPPPAELHRPSLLVRGLSPAVPAKRSRVGWIVAGIVLVNAAIAAVIVILLARPTPAPPVVAVAGGGGGSVDAQVRTLMKRLAREEVALQQKLVEIERLQAQIEELKERVRQAERRDPKNPNRQAPVSIPPVADCDEVSCVLGNYEAACCAKYRKPRPRTATKNPLPDGLDRAMISAAIALVKSRVSDCANQSTAKGMVKVRVRVNPAGHVTSVSVISTPDPVLGACVSGVIQRAVFERTQNGGAFSFPFMF